MNKTEFLIALLKCPGIGSTKAFKYIINNNFSIEKCYSNIEEIISKDNFELYINMAKKELEENKNKKINIITIFDDNYPSKLYTISDPILYLYYYGNISLLNDLSVAVIGTRHPSIESIEKTKIITKELANKYTIIGGLALGIDTIGHQTAIECGGKTIAVLPSSIDDIQPKSNKDLAKNIISSNGLLVTEYPVGTKLSNFNYAKRDRIQAALSDVIIVPEAKENSGTMIAIKKAYSENKKVYQLNNNNKEIKDSISLNDDYMKIIDQSIIQNQKEEKRKFDIINKINNNKQISLF